MADPLITIHDEFGDEITAGAPLSLPTAIPNTPTAPDLLISVRNNDADAGPVDSAFDFRLSITGRLSGAVTDPVAKGLNYLESRSLQAQVLSVSGGATAEIKSYVPIGTGATLSLGEIPDGGVINLGLRVLAPMKATIQAVEIFPSWESIQSTPLQEGSYDAHGNFIYDGNPGGGGVPDRTFTDILSKTGALAPELVNSDTVDTWTEIEYVLEGVSYTTTPAVPQVTVNDEDGAAIPLAAGQEYIYGIFLDGTNVFVIEKGLLGTAPLPDSARPATPSNTTPAGYVRVPFGLLIDTTVDVLEIGFFGIRDINGLDVAFGGGRAEVADRRNVRQTATTVTLPDDEAVVEVYVRPDIGMEAVVPPVGPTDPRAMIVRTITTAAGVVVLPTTDERRIGVGTVLNGPPVPFDPISSSMGFASPGGAGGPHIVVPAPGTFAGWTNATTLFESGGITADPLADQSGTPSAAFQVSVEAWYKATVTINGYTDGPGASDTIIGKIFINDVEPPTTIELSLNNTEPLVITTHSQNFVPALGLVDFRLTNSPGDASTNIHLVSVVFTLEFSSL